MNKKEFMEYLAFLSKLFSFEAPTDIEVLATWYKPLEQTNILIAKEMAQMYFKEEQGRFKLSKLLEYKSRAMAGKTYNEPKPKGSCEICEGTGIVQLEERHLGKIYLMALRCCCKLGYDSLPRYTRQVELMDLNGLHKVCGMYKIAPPGIKEAPENIKEAINKCVKSF